MGIAKTQVTLPGSSKAGPLSTTVGQGGVWGGIGSFRCFPQFPAVSSIDTGNWTVSDRVLLFQFEIEAPHAIGNIVTDISQALSGGATGIFDTGLYDVNGNLQCNTAGLPATPSGVVSTPLGAQIVLPAGIYDFAFTLHFTGGVATTFAPLSFALGNGFLTQALFNKNGKRYATSVNPAVLGVLPATTGGKIAQTGNLSDMPVVLFEP